MSILLYGRNINNYPIASVWATDEEGRACYEVEIEYGKNWVSCIWGLFKRMYSRRTLKYFFGIRKVMSDIEYCEKYRSM